MVTVVPPAAGPEPGDTFVTSGPKVNWSAGRVELVPPGPVTVMSTRVPAVPAGEVAVMDESELTVKAPLLKQLEPKQTEVASVNDSPVMVTAVPPADEPAGGETAETLGAGTK
jgi:hypothetical protein